MNTRTLQLNTSSLDLAPVSAAEISAHLTKWLTVHIGDDLFKSMISLPDDASCLAISGKAGLLKLLTLHNEWADSGVALPSGWEDLPEIVKARIVGKQLHMLTHPELPESVSLIYTVMEEIS